MDSGSLHWNLLKMSDPALDIDHPFDILIFELDSISAMQRGDSICTTSEYITTEPKSYINSFKRTIIDQLAHEDRYKDFKAIKQRVYSAMFIAELVIESSHLHIYHNPDSAIDKAQIDDYDKRIQKLVKIYETLKNLNKGLKNFKNTYPDDKKIDSNVNLLIENICEFCNKLTNKLNTLAEEQVIYKATKAKKESKDD